MTVYIVSPVVAFVGFCLVRFSQVCLLAWGITFRC